MKLSTSSSIFFATLALSSSSSTLAAPARDAADSGLSVLPSNHDILDSSVHPTAHCSAHRAQPQPTPVEGASEAITARSIPPDLLAILDELLSSLSTLPLLGNIFKNVSATGQNLVETEISSENMAVLQAVIQRIAGAVNNPVVSKTPVPSLVKNVAGGAIVAQSDFDPAGALAGSAAPSSASTSAQSSATPPSTHSVAINDVPSPSSTVPSASAIPSLVVPVNLPSPSLPIHLPV